MFSFCCIAFYDWLISRSFDGPGKIWDAVEVSGKNVMQTSSVVTTSVVTQRYHKTHLHSFLGLCIFFIGVKQPSFFFSNYVIPALFC